MTPADERRQFQRVSEGCVVDVRTVDADDPVLAGMSQPHGELQNISGGGVCLDLPDNPGSGSKLALKLHLPGFDSPVIALGKVVWARPGAAGRTEVGIEFWWVGWEDAEAQEKIRRFISSQLKPAAPAD